jgi:hypothetical protein
LSAPRAVSRAVVPEDVATQYFAFKRFEKAASNSAQLGPPPVRPQVPEFSTFSKAVSSVSSHTGHSVTALGIRSAAFSATSLAGCVALDVLAIQTPALTATVLRMKFLRLCEFGMVLPPKSKRLYLVLPDYQVSRGSFAGISLEGKVHQFDNRSARLDEVLATALILATAAIVADTLNDQAMAADSETMLPRDLVTQLRELLRLELKELVASHAVEMVVRWITIVVFIDATTVELKAAQQTRVHEFFERTVYRWSTDVVGITFTR